MCEMEPSAYPRNNAVLPRGPRYLRTRRWKQPPSRVSSTSVSSTHRSHAATVSFRLVIGMLSKEILHYAALNLFNTNCAAERSSAP
jgi:hypothetical protein